MKIHARWNALAILLALTTMFGCQGLSAAPSNQSRVHSNLALSSSSLDFGNVVVGSSSTLTITATNTEASAITVSSIASTAAEFSVNGPILPLTIAAGQSTTLSLAFTPNASGSVTGTISISSSASNSTATVLLSGSGVARSQLSAPASINFGTVILGSHQTKSATLTNTSDSIVTVSHAAIDGTGFQLGGPNPPITLNPGQSVSVSVIFAPQTGANDSGWISLTTSASASTSAKRRVRALSGFAYSANTGAAATTTTLVTIALSGQGVPPGQLVLAPASLSFGNVRVGTSQNQPVTLTNSGGSTVTVSQAAVTGTGFSVNGLTLPLTLVAGQSTNFNVALTPQTAGAANGSIAVASNASNSNLNLPLSGTGVSPGLLMTNPSSMLLGAVIVGSSQKLSGTLTNSGGESVTVSQATVTGNGFSLSGPALPLTLATGQGINFSVTFAPQATGVVSGSIAFASNASNSTLNVPLSGSGVAPGSLAPTPPGLNFGNVQTGNNQSLAETLTNSGGSSVTITQAAVTGSGFTMNGLNLPLTLAPGQSSPSFNVVFAPPSAGAASGSLSLTSNASNPTLNIPLSGTGVTPGTLAANPSSLSFGNVQTGNNQSLAETLTNSGGSSVTITQAAVTGSGFTMNGLNLPLTLAPGQSSPSFNVVFAPPSAGAASGSLSLTSNASNPTLNIPWSGTGVTPGTLAANPSSLSFGNVQTGNNQTLAETLTNSGGSSVTITQAAVTGSGFTMNGLNLPLTLAPGQSSPSFNVVFAPPSAGAASGSLSLTSNASNPTLNISLSGTGVVPGSLTANPSSLSFGNVQTGNNQSLAETLTNSGGSSVTITQAAVTGSGFTMNGLNLPLTLAPGQSSPSFNVVFAPPSAGAASGSLSLTSNASNPTLNIPWSGTGVTPGTLAANPSSLSFGNVQTGNNQSLAETLTNSGGSSVTITQAAVTGSGFTMNGLNLPLTLAPGQSSPSFNVVFAPPSAGAASGSLSLTSNASNPTLNIPLSGTGVTPGTLAANPSSLSFGNVQTGNNQSLAETLTNSGGSSVTITQAAVTGSGFTMNGLNLPLTLAPGQSSPSFNVVFAPQSAGAASGSLSLTSNASNPTLNIPWSGTGVTPGTLAANPSSLSFGNVQTGNNQSLAETLTNSGGSSVTITQAAVTGSGFTMNGLNLPLTLAPGQSSPSFNVVFAPPSAAAASGSLSLTSNASNPTLNIALSGTGVAPGTLTANPSSLSFGNVQTGNNQTLSETVTNVGGSSVTISQDTVTSTAFSVTGLNPPVILTSGQSITFSVIFTPSSAGSASGNLAVASNASNRTLNIALSGTGTAAGQLAVTPASLAFGNVVVATSANLPATLSATGASVTVTSANVSSSEFTLSGLSFPVTIPAGNNVQFTLAFTPQATGAASGTVSFASNASNSPALSLSGTGTPTPIHSVSLSWTASASSDVIGYNIYRGIASAGPYSKINSSLNAGTTYTDNAVVDGQTYYYVSTAVNSNNQESAYSSPAAAGRDSGAIV